MDSPPPETLQKRRKLEEEAKQNGKYDPPCVCWKDYAAAMILHPQNEFDLIREFITTFVCPEWKNDFVIVRRFSSIIVIRSNNLVSPLGFHPIDPREDITLNFSKLFWGYQTVLLSDYHQEFEIPLNLDKKNIKKFHNLLRHEDWLYREQPFAESGSVYIEMRDYIDQADCASESLPWQKGKHAKCGLSDLMEITPMCNDVCKIVLSYLPVMKRIILEQNKSFPEYF